MRSPLAPASLGLPFITVVSGVPRSGTSLMMQMLAAGGLELLADGVREPDAHNPRGYFEFEPAIRLRRDASWMASAVGKVVKVVHALVSALPPDFDYRLILMRRSLKEVAASQRAMLARRALQEPELCHERLAAIYGAQLDELEHWAQAQRNVALLSVDYNALVREPAAAAEAVDHYLGGGLDRPAMAAAVDPTLYRQRLG